MAKEKKNRLLRGVIGVGAATGIGALAGVRIGSLAGEVALVKRFSDRALKTLNKVRNRPRMDTAMGHAMRNMRRGLKEDMDIKGMLFGEGPRPYGQRLFEDRYAASRAGQRFIAGYEKRGAAIGAGVGGGGLAAAIGIDRAIERRKRRS